MESDGVSSLTVYIRMKGDPEEDLNFMVPTGSRVRDLHRIFQTLPVILSPYYFYDSMPVGFGVSCEPGYLTAEGGMLFTDKADDPKYVRHLDPDALVEDVLVNEQLIIPEFHLNRRRQLGVVGALAVWLYLDLPESLSPTPGTAPSGLIVRLLAEIFPFVKKETAGFDAFSTHFWQLFFFGFHTLKVLVIFLLFRIGIINPRSLNPWKRDEGPSVKDLTADKLKELGYTGLRRATPDAYMDKHRDHVIKEAGGVVKAHMQGLLEYKDGMFLKDGEGWTVYADGVPESKRRADIKFLNEDGKFVVSQRYLEAIAEHAYSQWQAASQEGPEQVEASYRQLVRFGFLDGPQQLRDLYRALHDERFPKTK